MIRLGSIGPVLNTLVQPPNASLSASYIQRDQNAQPTSPTTSSLAQRPEGQESLESSAFSTQISLASETDGSEVDRIAPAAEEGRAGPELAPSSSRAPNHPHTAMIVLAHSGQIYASSSTLSTHISSHPAPSVPGPSALNGFFVPQGPSSTSTLEAQPPTEPDGNEANGQSHQISVLTSLVGDERLRVLAGLATLSWREQVILENPTVPLVVLTELGLVLVQPLSGSGAAGVSSAGVSYSFPNSPQQDEVHSFGNNANTSSSSNEADTMLQLAQRRRAASLRASRLLLVLNSAVEPGKDVKLSPPTPAVEKDASTEGAEPASSETAASEVPKTAAPEATAAGYEAEMELLMSVASAGAQFLGPALASIAQA
ncbi:hypothetical protein V8E36_000983 [Tilletia maclaganii]